MIHSEEEFEKLVGLADMFNDGTACELLGLTEEDSPTILSVSIDNQYNKKVVVSGLLPYQVYGALTHILEVIVKSSKNATEWKADE